MKLIGIDADAKVGQVASEKHVGYQVWSCYNCVPCYKLNQWPHQNGCTVH